MDRQYRASDAGNLTARQGMGGKKYVEILQEFEKGMHKRFYKQGGDTDLFANK